MPGLSMSFRPTRITLFALGFALLGLLAGPSTAEEVEFPDFRVTCAGTGYYCIKFHEVWVETPGPLFVRYTVLSDTFHAHCSPVRVAIHVDQKPVETTPWMGWYEDGQPAHGPVDTGFIDLGTFPPGRRSIRLYAQGRFEGCNKGKLLRWGGGLTVRTEPAPPPPPPGLTWTRIDVPSTSPRLGLLQQASLDDGFLLSNIAQGGEGSSQGLAYLPTRPPNPASWIEVGTEGATLPTYRLPTTAGDLVAVRLGGVDKRGLDLARVPGQLTEPVHWQPIRSVGSLPEPRTVVAQIRSGGQTGSLIGLDQDNPGRRGIGLAYVPAAIALRELQWSAVASTGTNSAFHQAPVPGGVLMASRSMRTAKLGIGLTFLPGDPVTRLDFVEVPATGSDFTTFRAEAPGGSLYLSHDERPQPNPPAEDLRQLSEDLVFVPSGG